jgi:hypothetical protein
MKKILAIILSCLIILSLVGCGGAPTTVSVNVENKDSLSNGTFGKAAMVEIGDSLWYDTSTRIVYWWNGSLAGWRADTTPTPYYAPNGLPYRYNPETNTFEEIGEE